MTTNVNASTTEVPPTSSSSLAIPVSVPTSMPATEEANKEELLGGDALDRIRALEQELNARRLENVSLISALEKSRVNDAKLSTAQPTLSHFENLPLRSANVAYLPPASLALSNAAYLPTAPSTRSNVENLNYAGAAYLPPAPPASLNGASLATTELTFPNVDSSPLISFNATCLPPASLKLSNFASLPTAPSTFANTANEPPLQFNSFALPIAQQRQTPVGGAPFFSSKYSMAVSQPHTPMHSHVAPIVHHTQAGPNPQIWPAASLSYWPLTCQQQQTGPNVLNGPTYVMPQNNVTAGLYTPRKLPELPEFSGEAEDWPIFITAFNETSAAYRVSNLENNQRLVKALKGEARETVKSLLIHPDNVASVVEQLHFRYGRPEQLIRSQLQQIRDVQAISENAIGKIVPFAAKVKNFAVFMQSVNGLQHLSNPTLLEELVSKLPLSKRLEWARVAMLITPYPTIVHFSNWISEMASIICTVQDVDNKEAKRRTMLHVNEESTEVEVDCPMCQGQHYLSQCKDYALLDVPKRWKLAKGYRICFSCLKQGHAVRNCRQKKPCGVKGCTKSHHKLLHDEDDQLVLTDVQQLNEPARLATNLSCVTNETKLLFRILPVVLYGPNKRVETYALFDEGSSVSLIDNELIKELGLNADKGVLNLQWFGGRSAREPANVVDLKVSGSKMKKRHALKNVYGISNLNLPMQSLKRKDVSYAHAKLPIEPYNNAVPKILIGLDHAHLGLATQTKHLSCRGPYAAKTELGWVVFGPSNAEKNQSAERTCLFSNASLNCFDKQISEYFEIENFGIKPSPPVENADDVRAKHILETATQRIGNRFQTGLLWREQKPQLPDSFSMALNRLTSIEKKMSRDEVFAKAYCDIIIDYVNKGYARKITPDERSGSCPGPMWYLPHFAVVNPNKPGKLRLVFDAAASVRGISLNSFLLKGPQNFKQLPPVLFQFREGKVAVCGDIKEMFHQVLIRPEDRSAQRFLWRNGNRLRDVDVYEMQVMTFGATCSPCAAHYVKDLNAHQHTDNSPRAIESIIDHHYVDDFVDSFVSIEEAIQITQEVKLIHAAAGFELRRFTSNSLDVLNALESYPSSSEVSWSESEEKILGIYWQPSTDEFKFNLKFHRVPTGVMSGERIPTKREFLSIIMSVYDPMGFLNCLTAIAKLLMREIWRRDVLWDEALPADLATAWSNWNQQLKQTTHFRVPRHYFRRQKPQHVQIHIFVDASEDMYAAVVYLRFATVDSGVNVSFVVSKTRCAPLKCMTIPRLELQAAVLGTRLLATVQNEHKTRVESKWLWSDSKTTLKWINSSHRRYKPFVAHRVAEILDATSPLEWRWISTKDNVADEATRGNKNIDFGPDSRWLNGPEFLKLTESNWPVNEYQPTTTSDDEELPTKTVLLAMTGFPIEFDRFGSLLKLVRTAAWVLRFLSRLRKDHVPNADYGLTAEECQKAECQLILQVQRDAFRSEICNLQDERPIDAQSKLHSLTPYIDDQGLLRVYGRLTVAGYLPYSVRHPIILPYDHMFTELVVKGFHEEMRHQNEEAIVCKIRQKFWIVRLRQLLRKVAANCYICRIRKVQPVCPLMGSLPEDRTTPNVRPFTFTGLDYFGPVTVAIGRRVEKRWVAVFTCLTIRAVHLELAHDLSTDSCIIAIRNFINRRGVPRRLRSDNGTNFVGADSEAKRFSEVFEPQRIQEELSSRNIEWYFNCPSNPSEGGIWERMVRAVKRVLSHSVQSVTPREHVLQCFLIEAENVVNSRPLTHLPIGVDQEAPLTPNDLLIGTANVSVTPSCKEELERMCATRKQWRIAKLLRDRFWRRWVLEYLPTLTRREKWCARTKPLQPGDVVFICDPNIPRIEWRRGVIEELFPGRDGVARRASVRVVEGDRPKLTMRPVSRLAVLDLE